MSKSLVQSAVITARDILSFGFGGPSERTGSASAASHTRGRDGDGAYRITAVCAQDMVEIEDAHAARQRIVLSYGAREMLDLEMKRRRAATPVGLKLRREAFDVDGIAFTRWAMAD